MKLNPNEELVVVEDVASAARVAAERVVSILKSSEQRSHTVALAGGKTPAAMYRLLTQPPFRDEVDWNSIDWFWADERCVPPDHADSNFRMAMENLLTPLSVPGDRVHRMPADAAELDAASQEHEQTIRRLVPANATGVPAFDLVLLGIGADGHTASLFPGSNGLAERGRLVISHYAPGPAAMRMTFTYPLLWAARNVMFLVCGADKAEAIREILTLPPEQGPPAAQLRCGKSQITWILDAPAARLVSPPAPA